MQTQSYKTLLEISQRVNWRIEDIIGGDKRLDFSRPFLPETFARTGALGFLSPPQRLTLNHIRARGYLATFELVEQFIAPFVTGESGAEEDPSRAAALDQFVREEVKHMELFRRFLREFDEGFGIECGLIGPADDIKRAVLGHDPLAVTITLLGLEWMSQGHYVESVKDNQALDPHFKSLLKHHWVEECQHAKLDGLMLLEMWTERSETDRARAIEEYLEIVAFFDAGFKEQAKLDLASFERASARVLPEADRKTFLDEQHQALRWTFLGSAMQNRNFLSVLGSIDPGLLARVRAVAPTYC